MIKLKNATILRALMGKTYNPILIDIECWLAEKYGVTITEAWREQRHKADVHGTDPGRGIDNRVWEYKPETLMYEIQSEINQKWEYDPGRPKMMCCYIHNSGQGLHMHIQTHPNTRLRKF